MMTSPSTAPEVIAARTYQTVTDSNEIMRALHLLVAPGQVVELRALEVSTPDYKAPHTVSGYFNDWRKLAEAARQVAPHARGVYITPNPVNPALSARAHNRARAVNGKDPTTSDTDILARRWLLIDADPVRPSGISSSDAEHTAALERANAIRDFLKARGWPLPILGDSGNGGHLLFPVDLPADDGGLIERVLKALAFWFDDDVVTVDQKVFNPARIWKLYGTSARKGDHTPARPHRLARILENPATLAPVSRELLEALAAEVPHESPDTHPAHTGFDIDAWIEQYSLDLLGPHEWKGGRKWIFKVCPWNTDHTNRSAYLLQMPSGAIAAGCHHNGCKDRDWHALRDVIEPGWDATRPMGAGVAEAERERPSLEFKTWPFTDTANGERLASRYGRRLRYVGAWGWLAWDGTRWRRDDTQEVDRLAKEVARSIYAEAQTAATDKAAKKLASWAAASQSKSKLQAMIWAAQSETVFAARPSDFDADPWLLNVATGVINLRTGELVTHSDSLHLTKLAPVEYHPNAHSDLWMDFLYQIFGENVRLVDFAQRAVGYTLTGNTSEQCLFYCHGRGANGKTTFLETLRALFGDFGQQAEFSTFLEKQADGVRNDVARMHGARLVCAIESGEGRKLNEPLIKNLTGQDTLTARYLYREYFEFRPQFKVWLAANHDPIVRGTDNALWRRIRKIPFTVTFLPDKQDKCMAEKLRAELPGVLAWAVRGCLAWQKEGLNPPAEVEEATASYRAEMDTFAVFLSDCCIVKPGTEAKASELYKAYKDWGGDENQRAFGLRLREHGLKPGKSSGGVRVWRGIGLVDAKHSD